MVESVQRATPVTVVAKPQAPTRDERGRFLKGGVPGNPNGREKGSKNKMTLIREQLEGNLADDGITLLTKATQLAERGNTTMLKFLLERLLPKNDDSNKGTGKISVNINNMTEKEPTSIEIIEAKPTQETTTNE